MSDLIKYSFKWLSLVLNQFFSFHGVSTDLNLINTSLFSSLSIYLDLCLAAICLGSAAFFV